jgi:hypothetical protein
VFIATGPRGAPSWKWKQRAIVVKLRWKIRKFEFYILNIGNSDLALMDLKTEFSAHSFRDGKLKLNEPVF